jgi:4-hydroxybenzoate polyprenyltransferase
MMPRVTATSLSPDETDHGPAPQRGAAAVMQALRPHQWSKNVLLFVPLVLAHRLNEPALLADAVLAFVALCFVASGTYVVNDLVDRDRDRRHPLKQNRPFASGALSPGVGYAMVPVLVGVGVAISLLALPLGFTVLLGAYIAVTLSYSFALKRVAALDVVVLGGLYALRVLMGGEVTGIPVSDWLVAFSLFFFLGLAILKRYAELRLLEDVVSARDNGRGYAVDDLEMLRAVGPATAFLAVLVLVLYITSPEVQVLYTHPFRLWALTPLVITWTMHMWLMAHRRLMPDDPIVYTAKDPASWAVFVLAALVFFVAS